MGLGGDAPVDDDPELLDADEGRDEDGGLPEKKGVGSVSSLQCVVTKAEEGGLPRGRA